MNAKLVLVTLYFYHMRGSGGVGWGSGAPDPPRKSQVIIGCPKNTSRDPFDKQLGPIASRGASVRPSVKFVDD